MSNQEQQTKPAGRASVSTAGLGALLPCPFCGKSDTLEVITGSELMDEDQEYWQHSESYGVVCSAANPGGKGGCGAMGGFSETEAAAVAMWNTRAPNAS